MTSACQQELDGPKRTRVCVERKRFSRGVKMSKVKVLRALVNQRLAAAAEEIFGLFEKTIAEYEEELSSSREENERQRRLLDAVSKPEVKLKDSQVVQEDDQPDLSTPHIEEDLEDPESLQMNEDQEDPEPLEMNEDQEDPDPPHIKEEPDEVWISQEEEQLKEADIKFSFSPVTSDDDDDEDSGEPEPDIQQLLVVNEDVPPEQQDSNPDQEDPEPPHIKEEQEELWISQEGEQLQGPKEADIRFPFAPVKSEDEDEEEDDDDEDEGEGQSSQLHQNQTVETRRAKRLKTGADREEVGSVSEKPADSKTGVKPFQCSVCGKRFARQRFLSQHMTVHTGEKPFSCSVCDKTFARKGNLKYHMTVHTGEKPFSCSVCGKKFPLEQTMKRHLIVHSEEKPFSCSICGKTFSLEQTLKRHLTVHSEEKPFSCVFCGKTFALKGRLNCHMTVHTGGESFQFYENIE
ncbi:zinc finger and SCAN domain-containing protein 31-like isoform X3 [Clinocottus analis]|uniref:zinc finger and SCAN domain-containing protein 31-like isoform X3 n=1 Tax=Clinocottus analis TaxID=304258 RepID=UPI0035BEF41C